MSFKRFDGSNYVDISSCKRFDGTNWVDAQEVKRFDGANWVSAWSAKKFRPNLVTGSGTTAIVNSGIMTAHVEGVEKSVISVYLTLLPRTDFTLPCTMEIDWQWTNPNTTYSTIYGGVFDINGGFLSGYNTNSHFSRKTATIQVQAAANSYYIGMAVTTDQRNAVKQALEATVYSISINGTPIPIRQN